MLPELATTSTTTISKCSNYYNITTLVSKDVKYLQMLWIRAGILSTEIGGRMTPYRERFVLNSEWAKIGS